MTLMLALVDLVSYGLCLDLDLGFELIYMITAS